MNELKPLCLDCLTPLELGETRLHAACAERVKAQHEAARQVWWMMGSDWSAAARQEQRWLEKVEEASLEPARGVMPGKENERWIGTKQLG